MRLQELQRQRDQLSNLLGLARAQTDEQLKARLTEFACVRTSGFVEQVVRTVCYDYAQRRGDPSLATFVSRRLRRDQNLSADRLRRILEDFESSWAEALDKFLTDERKSALNSVVTNRNRIAHGENVSLGLVQMTNWLDRVTEIVEFLEDQYA